VESASITCYQSSTFNSTTPDCTRARNTENRPTTLCELFALPSRVHSVNPYPYCPVKLAFHDTDTDIFARILADTSDTRDFLKLFLRQAERHADILATILARMSARMSVSVSASCNASCTHASGSRGVGRVIGGLV